MERSILLEHARKGWCTDPDCELHHIEVAIEEEVVTPADVAFWLSGWAAAVHHMTQALEEVRDEAIREGLTLSGDKL